MAIRSKRDSIIKNISNIPGWRTKQRLVVFESDDWGSIRMPSKKVFNELSVNGIDLKSDDGFRYNKYDSLASSEDLTALYDVLSSVKGGEGHPAVLTPFSVVANPDFAKILQSDFTEYFFEPITETFSRYPGCDNSFGLWKEGIEKGLFQPQFHGREHLNVNVWMRALKGGHDEALKAFHNNMWGISTAHDPKIKVEFQAAFDFIDPADLIFHHEAIVSGLNLFEELFGYRANFFVPPNGVLSSKLEEVCVKEGIKYMSASKFQIEPLGKGKSTKKIHWLGQRNQNGLVYIPRNCFFEPSQPGRDWVDSCLYEISNAFRWNKPAVISTHRVNFIGSLYKENRDNGLNQLSILLKQIVKSWPEAEFISSADLGGIISND